MTSPPPSAGSITSEHAAVIVSTLHPEPPGGWGQPPHGLPVPKGHTIAPLLVPPPRGPPALISMAMLSFLP